MAEIDVETEYGNEGVGQLTQRASALAKKLVCVGSSRTRRKEVSCLLGELGDGQGAVLLRAAGRERSEAGHEEVKTREGHHVDGQLAQIGVQLTGEAKARGHTRHRHLQQPQYQLVSY